MKKHHEVISPSQSANQPITSQLNLTSQSLAQNYRIIMHECTIILTSEVLCIIGREREGGGENDVWTNGL